MGSVYLASRVDGEFSKHVAIKFIRTSRISPAALRRFKAERQILADIDHPKIARLIDGGSAEGMLFFIMDSSRATRWRKSSSAVRCRLTARRNWR